MNTKIQPDVEHDLALTTGQKLRQAREKLGLSQKEIARYLCLRQVIIENIENDENALGLEDTFIRGYLRAYARYVNITDEELNIGSVTYFRSATIEPARLKDLPRNKHSAKRKRDSYLMAITWIIITIVLGLTGLWWWQNYILDHKAISAINEISTQQLVQAQNEGRVIPTNNAETPIVVLPAQSTLEANEPDTVKESVESTLPSTVALQQRQTLFPDQAGQLTEQAQKEAEIDANRIVMTFNGSSWVSINQKVNGQTQNLFKGTKNKGETLNIDGTPPYFITLGNPTAVEMTMGGKPIVTKEKFTLSPLHDEKG